MSSVAIGLAIACPTIVSAGLSEGRVVDFEGRTVPHVMVTATNPETEVGGVAVTDEAGGETESVASRSSANGKFGNSSDWRKRGKGAKSCNG